MKFFKNKWTWVGIAVLLIAAWLIMGDAPMLPGSEATPTE
jgi:hypothetical protein